MLMNVETLMFLRHLHAFNKTLISVVMMWVG